MRLTVRPLLCALSIALGCLAAGGCGTSAPAGPPQVTLSLTAPTSGATVGVRTVIVTGTVTPAHAVVRVAGKRVRVRRGSFADPMYLDGRTTKIKIVARARGYRTARMETTVHYSASTARVMLLARRAATSVKALMPAAAGGGTVLGPMLNSAAGRAEFMSGCAQGGGQAQACTCFYDHLSRSGDFHTRAGQTATLQQMIQAAGSGNFTAMPVSVRSAVVACAGKVLDVPAAGGAPSG